MLYVLRPELSDVDPERAGSLLAGAGEELDDVPTSQIGAGALVSCEPGEADGVVFFNSPRPEFAAEVGALLERAAAAGTVILPIAMDPEDRRPVGAASDHQSFDVADQLRRRDLADDQLALIGAAFAREALSATMPTYMQSRLRIFLCHRREDGEGTTASVDQALSNRHDHVFRDLIDVQTGEQAQLRIDDALAGADVLVFLDTPRAGESWWIDRELAAALGRAIPIVWVRLGSDDNRVELRVKPDAKPHITVDDVNLTATQAGALADDVLALAAHLARRHLRTSKQALHSLKRWASEHHGRVEVLDARRQIVQVRYPAHAQQRVYPLRVATDIVQFFGRAVGDSDRHALAEFLTERGMGPHDRECRAFDAAIMLDPTAGGRRAAGEWSVTEHPAAFLGSLRVPTTRPESRRLLLLGAFPAGDLARDQVAAAVHAAAATWLRCGGTIVCGGHPTFVPLLVEAVRLIRGEAARGALVIFQSQWFAAPARVAELARHATVVVTPSLDTRDTSLTAMRQQMVAEGGAAAVLAIGGRTDEQGTHRPGIEEEIRLSRLAGLPVHLLGAPGGHAGQLAAREAASPRPWEGLGNRLDDTTNAFLRETDAYEEAVRRIWESMI
jgi:hypothetical protein